MAMSDSSMANRIANNLNALGINEPSPEQLNMLTAMCQGIIDEITANAVTTTPVTSGSSAGEYDGTVK